MCATASPRITVRICDGLRSLRSGVAADVLRAWNDNPFAVRRIAIVFGSSQGASLAARVLERAAIDSGLTSFIMPALTTASAFWLDQFGARRRADPILREAILARELRRMEAEGSGLPFKIHQGAHQAIIALSGEMDDFGIDLDAFEKTCDAAFAGIIDDPGPQRMYQLSRFVVASLRGLAGTLMELGLADPAAVRRAGSATPSRFDTVHIVDDLPIGDLKSFAGLPGLTRLVIWTTARQVRAGTIDRLRGLFDGLAVEHAAATNTRPRLLVSATGSCFIRRDREEDLLRTALLIKQMYRSGQIEDLDQVAVVFSRPLPYLYLAKRTFAMAGVPFQAIDNYPLAIEPWAGAVDLILELAAGGFRRADGIALHASPYFDFAENAAVGSRLATAELDTELRRRGFVSGQDGWEGSGLPMPALREIADESTGIADKAGVLLRLIQRHGKKDGGGEGEERSRGAVIAVLSGIEAAYREARETERVSCAGFRAILRRWIQSHTFAPRLGDAGVHLVQDNAARHGDFSHIFFVGLVADEWPRRPRRSILYSQAFLSSAGWPSDSSVAATQRASFLDLIDSAASAVGLSAFVLEEDSPVSLSPFVELVETSLEPFPAPADDIARRIADEATAISLGLLTPEENGAWKSLRSARARRARIEQQRFAAQIGPRDPGLLAVSEIDRYLTCPFLSFVRLLGLSREDDPEEGLTAPQRGRILHAVLQDFFQEWDRSAGGGARAREVQPSDWPEFRQRFMLVLEKHLGSMPARERELERMRYEGSSVSRGFLEKLFQAEIQQETPLRARLLELPFEGTFLLKGESDAVRTGLKGRMDRLDIRVDDTVQVIDYKLGKKPDPRVATQLDIYSECLKQLPPPTALPAVVECDARYYPFGEDEIPTSARREKSAQGSLDRAVAAVKGMTAGIFAPKPYDPIVCTWCAFGGLCRKEIKDT
ncbi:MAG: PD-(D/E)XK nuclease family protein [Acidobacteria bacterium]|nr:PD-(D/E)XK nuclease family protein [Acidobacteriota bacterium]